MLLGETTEFSPWCGTPPFMELDWFARVIGKSSASLSESILCKKYIKILVLNKGYSTWVLVHPQIAIIIFVSNIILQISFSRTC